MELQRRDNPGLALIETKRQTEEACLMTSGLSLRVAAFCLFVISLAAPLVAQEAQSSGVVARPVAVARPLALSDAAALVSEFDVNGLKVLIKRREGSQTVVAGLFIKGGARNISAVNAGIENLMLDAASEATVNFPRQRLRTELSRMGTAISSGVNYDYSALTLGSTRANFDRSWDIFTDVALRPAFTIEDVERVRNRIVLSIRGDADTPDSYLQALQAHVAYAGHPYLNDPHGTAEAVSRLALPRQTFIRCELRRVSFRAACSSKSVPSATYPTRPTLFFGVRVQTSVGFPSAQRTRIRASESCSRRYGGSST